MPPSPSVSAPTFEHHDTALGVDERRPRVSWQVRTDEPGWRQQACEIEVRRDSPLGDGTGAAHDSRGPDAWRSGRLDLNESVLVDWPTTPLAPRERAKVRVRVWGEGSDGPSDWSMPGIVEAGLGPSDWVARVVGPPQPWTEDQAQPLVRGDFFVDGEVASARLYSTAHGVYELEVNGQRVGDEVLAPGWTSYHHRLRYATHDVTHLLRSGDNVVGAWLAPGWYAGRLGFHGGRSGIWGDRIGLLAQLEVVTTDGSRITVASDETWRWTTGPIQQASIYDGEAFDERLVREGWSTPEHDLEEWSGVTAIPRDRSTLVGPNGPPVRCTEEREPTTITSTDDGALLVDFGENVVGRLRLRTAGPAGTTIRVRHAEVLEHGELAVRPLRGARATDAWTLAGTGTEEWEPRFTFHGFRYAEISGWPGEPEPGDVVARVLHSDMRRTGWFSCSDEAVNQLHANVVRSMRGNFLDVPTDCPQRDERLGWTGDLQVFDETASFLYASAGTITSWLRDVAADQAEDGTVPVYVPWFVVDEAWGLDPIAVWGDVAVLTPWTIFERFGDERILHDQYDSARRWVDRLARQAPDGVVRKGRQLGDWLDPAAPPDDPADARTDRYLVATAYLAHSARVLARIADRTGHPDGAERYGRLSRRVRRAFADEYLREDGRLRDEAVTAYALALVFELLPTEEQVAVAGRRLVALVEDEGHRIATGFAGTPAVLHALTKVGADDTAYRLLLQTDCPSWLYAVQMGATTVWERWDSMLPDGSINPGEMTSFNHYALGAVADWLHRRVAGLAPGAPGYRHVLVEPRPGGGLAWARAQHDGPYGSVSVSWSRSDQGQTALEVVLPPNTTGTVRLPDGHGLEHEIGSGTHHFTW